MAEGSSTYGLTNTNSRACCFLLKCNHRGEILPAEFKLLLTRHQHNTIILRHGIYKWPVVVGDRSFEEGWDEYCHENITNKHDMLLLRHTGNLIFDVIHFSELQKQVYLSWTVPLPNLFQASADHAQDSADSLIIHRWVASSIKPDLIQNLTDSVSFYQTFNTATPNTLKIPRFVDHFVNEERTPTLLFRTGEKLTEIGVKGKKLKTNWRSFVLQHQLQHNEVLVFIPESSNTFTVMVFDDNGIERVFPWSCIFKVYSNYPSCT